MSRSFEDRGGRSPLIIKDLDLYPQPPTNTRSPTLNSEEPVDGVKVEQGSAAYVGDRLAKDTDFHQKMRENPALWEAVKDGRVTVYSDVAIARSGNAGKIDFRTEPIELDPAHIARIDQAIKGY